MPSELDLDHAFWKAISTNSDFRAWFLGNTKFKDRNLDLVTDEKWHQRWYKDPITQMESEGDILLIFKDRVSETRYAIHIENKPMHGVWRPFQPENYKIRAKDRMKKWRYDDYEVVIIAPASFLDKSLTEVGHFHKAISYEDIGKFVPEFRDACTART